MSVGSRSSICFDRGGWHPADDRQATREIGARIEAFATALKRDRPLDRLLRERELGVSEGSGLDRVVQAREEEVSHTLRRDLGISLGRGRSLGMGM